ncbi:MAG: MauE/DoxX family redox-associated membrane protein [Actinomycetota bacterium]
MDRSALDAIAIGCAILLAGVFVFAAVAKARDPEGTARDFASLGLPRPRWWAAAVPVAEAVTAALLVLAPGWGGVAAATLLAGFTANLATVVRSGRVAHCACFGGASTEPVSVRHLVRNAVLLIPALAASTVDGWIWSGG